MRRPVRICEYPGCTAVVKAGHPYPLTERYCPEHRDQEPSSPVPSEEQP